MPAMTGIVHHNDPIHYSLSNMNNAYFNATTSTSSSPQSLSPIKSSPPPSTRKRKQDIQYSNTNSEDSSRSVLDMAYSPYSQFTASTEDSTRTIYATSDPLCFHPQQNDMNMQTSSDSGSTPWNNTIPFLPNQPHTTYDINLINQSSILKPSFGQFMSDITQQANSDDGVGETREMTDINQMLDQYPFENSQRQTTANRSYEGYSGEQQQSMREMESLHQRQQQQFIQSWSSTGLSSPIQSPTSSQQGYSPNTPAFFNPGFLASLQEGDESYPADPFTFMPRQNQNAESHSLLPLNWNSSNCIDHPIDNVMSENHTQSNILQPSPPLSSSPIVNDRASYSSASSSPPITPIYGQLTNLSIQHHSAPPSMNYQSNTLVSSASHSYSDPAKDAPLPHESRLTNSTHERRFIPSGVANSRLMQSMANEAKMKPLIRKYLSSNDANSIGERTVVILTSKVAQKSYGTEKRFLCPPPTAILIGTSWWTNKKPSVDGMDSNEILRIPGNNYDDEIVLAPPKVTVSISGEASSQPGQIEWYTISGATVGQTGHIKSLQPQQAQQQEGQQHPSRFRSSESRNSNVDWYHNHQQERLAAGKCVSKHLYINDADEKRKRVECIIRVQLANGMPLGVVASKGIKVISKPSKKRQSVKNMELCIHHGTTVSLFNRIRSQTVSTKYLGVSSRSGSPFTFPGQPQDMKNSGSKDASDGTCFVARTTCWDPFVIWVVDTTRSPADGKESDTPEDFIGRHASTRNVPYPPPPAIALKNETNQLIPIHYNQHVVLQCLTTGLVSPVMIIRKVDKASTVVGGAKSAGEDINAVGGGEYGDEVLGDPVSQLHKVALQIVQDPSFSQSKQQDVNSYFNSSKKNSIHYTNMMPRTSQPVTYLACLNDMVGMHKTTEPRKPIQSLTPPMTAIKTTFNSSWDDSLSNDLFDVTSQEGGKIVRKRRVSTDIGMLKAPGKLVTSMSLNDIHDTHAPLSSDMTMMRNQESHRRRVNSLNDDYTRSYYPMPSHTFMSQQRPDTSRKSSVSSNGSTTPGRRSSVASGANALSTLGAYWSEDVSDAAVWTIVGTDCATYTFLSPNYDEQTSTVSATPFPSLTHFKITTSDTQETEQVITMHGENFSRDLQVWFGDMKIAHTEYRSRELIICRIPDTQEFNAYNTDKIPILLVRGDGTVCKTNHFYQLKN